MATLAPAEKTVLVEPPGVVASSKTDGAGLHVGLVFTRQCAEIVDALMSSCRAELLLKGVARSHLHELQVSLPFELPYAVKRLIQTAPPNEKLDAVVCIGCLVKGKTMSFEQIGEAVTRGVMKVGMMTKTPVINGVLTCENEAQAKECAGLTKSKVLSHGFGVEWAQSVITMGKFNRKAQEKLAANCKCHCHCVADCACSCGCTKCQDSAEGCNCKDCICSKCKKQTTTGLSGKEKQETGEQQQGQQQHQGEEKQSFAASVKEKIVGMVTTKQQQE